MSDLKQIDARGLSCPQPVILTQKAIKDTAENFKVMVNSVVSRENVLRCVQKNRLQAEVTEEGDDFIIEVTR